MSEHGADGSGSTETQSGAEPRAPRIDPLIGQVLDGRYRIEAVLGEGGMGIVYKAVHTSLRKPLAIKVLRPEVSKNEEIVARFRQEAQSASQIGNQHIIDISDFGELPDGSTYFVMEFLGGRSLTSASEAEPFTLTRILHVVRQLCRALGAAHEIGIVHRDMKPDNVQLVDRGGDRDFVKVLDFGIAKVGGSTSKLTQAGQVFGTPHYMSPEQCAGTSVDQRTDIYAVGVMLYELAAGKVPFDADNLMGILTKHLYENPIPPRELPPPGANVPPALEAVILKCLAKKPELRYQSMNELLEDLDAVEAGLPPRASIERAERGSQAGHTEPDFEHPVRMTVGLGTTDAVPGRKPVMPLLIGGVLLVGAVVTAVLVFSSQGPDAQHIVAPAATAQPAAPASGAAQPAAVPVAAPTAPPALPLPSAAQTTQIAVSSDPEHVEVYRDGVLLGKTPFTLVRPTGSEQVKLDLRLSGYEHKAVAVTASSGESLPVTLERAKTTRRAPVPRPPPAAVQRPERPKPEKPHRGAQNEVLDPWD